MLMTSKSTLLDVDTLNDVCPSLNALQIYSILTQFEPDEYVYVCSSLGLVLTRMRSTSFEPDRVPDEVVEKFRAMVAAEEEGTLSLLFEDAIDLPLCDLTNAPKADSIEHSVPSQLRGREGFEFFFSDGDDDGSA